MRTLHIGIRVADLARSLAFYSAVGYEVVGEVPGTATGSLTMMKLPGDDFVSLELVHDAAEERIDAGGLNHMVIQVDEMRATIADLTARGIDAEPPVSPDGSEGFLTAWLQAPDGYRIELVQWPPGHPRGMTGTDLEKGDAG